MSKTQNWANPQFIPYNNPPQYQDQPPQYDNYIYNYQRVYEQQQDSNYYQDPYNNNNNPYSQNYQFQQPQPMGYPYSLQTNNNNQLNQMYAPQSLEQTNQTKAMAGYKRMNYQHFNQNHLMQNQSQLRQNTGTSFSSHYPTYDKMASYNGYYPKQNIQLNPIIQQQDKRIEHQQQQPSFTNDKQDNMNTEIKTLPNKTHLMLNPKAEPYQRKAPPITETARQAEPVSPPPMNNKSHLTQQINEPRKTSPKKEEPQEIIIERDHFEVPKHKKANKDDPHIKWAITYLKSFQNWDLSNNKDLLNTKVLNHLEKMKIHFDEGPNITNNTSSKNTYNKGKFSNSKGNDYSKNDKRLKQNEDNNVFTRGGGGDAVLLQSDMGKWGRKDFSEEVKKAEIFKKKLDEIKDQDPIKFDLTEYLNMLTVDNYNDTKQLIFSKIKDGIENQKKFLEVLFQKAVHEKAFVTLYAKLCRDLDKELPKKADRTHGKKTTSSEMRSKLIDKCKEIFKIDNNEQIDGYIKVKDPEERENKIKKFILGNVNFIGELINIKLLSKKVVFQCIDMLFTRYEKGDEGNLRLISLEGIVILTDKFGTLIHKQRDSIEDNDFKDFVKNINTILDKLNFIQKKDNIPGYVRYKIINVIEKKKRGWEESQYEKNITAKGKEEIRKAYEESQRKGTNKDTNSKQLTQEQIDDRIRDDLTEFKDFIEEGNDLNKYTWEIITEIYNNRKHSIAEIMRSFIENCIDFVQNESTLTYSQQYWEELIRYYGPNLEKNEKKEIIEQCLDLLYTVNSISLDNPMLIDVWANILYSLNKHDVMSYYELNNLKEIGDNDLKSVFEIMKKIGKIDNNSFKTFEKLNLVMNYKEIYDDIIEE